MKGQVGCLRKVISSFYLLPFAIVLAVCGFSYSLATTNPPGSASQASPRSVKNREVGEGLRFTNPFLLVGSTTPGSSDPVFFPQGGETASDPQGFDLGDAALGTPIVRYINGAGGFLPYEFNARPVVAPAPIGSGVVDGATGIYIPPQRLPFGKLSTFLPTGLGNVVRFDVTLSDLISEPRIGRFKLNIVNLATTPFKFAQDRLPNAQKGQSYFTNIQTVAAPGNVRFEAVENSIVVNNVTYRRLEDAGLTLAPDGTLFGRPAKPFDIQFRATAIATNDIRYPAIGPIAASRDGTDPGGQTFILKVETPKPVSTELAASQCMARGVIRDTPPTPEQALRIKDSFTYTGYLDSKGETAASLAGNVSQPFVLRIGGGVYSGNFSDKGKIKIALDEFGNPVSPTSSTPAPGSLDVSFSAKTGRITAKLKNVDLTSALGRRIFGNSSGEISNSKTVQPLIISFEIGSFRTCEVLQVETNVRNGRYSMQYRLGSRGYSRGGVFQILTTTGIDNRDETSSRWLIRFLGVPAQDEPQAAPNEARPTATTVLSGTSKATIRIGDSFSQDCTVALKQVRLEFKATHTDAGIFQLLLDPKKFVHRLETNFIASSDTGVPAAITTKDATIFRLGMDLTTSATTGGFTGETGRVIVPDRSTWFQK